jgi:hypothetical protein
MTLCGEALLHYIKKVEVCLKPLVQNSLSLVFPLSLLNKKYTS